MRKSLCAVLATLGLSACAQAYDTSAVPSATSSLLLALDRCKADATAGKYSSITARMECGLTADQAFAVAVKLHDMTLFTTYAARERLLAAQADAGMVPKDQVVKQYTDIRAQYMTAVDQEQAQANEKNERTRLALRAAAAAMRAASEQQERAAEAARANTFNCTSVTTGPFTNTNCH